MQCENKFCVYWKNDVCMLDCVSLDVMGCCRECIYAEIDEDTLNRAREIFHTKEESRID